MTAGPDYLLRLLGEVEQQLGDGEGDGPQLLLVGGLHLHNLLSLGLRGVGLVVLMIPTLMMMVMAVFMMRMAMMMRMVVQVARMGVAVTVMGVTAGSVMVLAECPGVVLMVAPLLQVPPLHPLTLAPVPEHPQHHLQGLAQGGGLVLGEGGGEGGEQQQPGDQGLPHRHGCTAPPGQLQGFIQHLTQAAKVTRKFKWN